MKKIIICAALLVIATKSFSQETHPKTMTREEYLQKNKNQKTVGWVLLGGGAVIDIIGVATFPKDYDLFNIFGGTRSHAAESKANTSAALLVVGSAAMLASIPFFTSSHVNKKKALSFTIVTQTLHQIRNSNFQTVDYPALTMKIRL